MDKLHLAFHAIMLDANVRCENFWCVGRCSARFLQQFGVLVLFAKMIFNYYENSMQLEVHASLLVDIIMRRQTRGLSVLAAIAALVCGFAVASA